MLLQTIKSRNLWLWGETIMPSSETSEANKLKSDIQDLEQAKEFYEINNINNSKKPLDFNSIEYTNAKINEKQKQLEEVQKVNNGGTVNNINYTRSYTTPFKITALQSIDIQWDNPIGEAYGIKTNFLQAWHNKPVNITFTGVSYFGAFGGETVGDLEQDSQDNQSKVMNTLGNIGGAVTSAISGISNSVQDTLNKDKMSSEVEGKYDILVDNDIYKINDLMSRYGEGMFKFSNANESSFWTHLLLENEKGADGSKNYAIFVGHIKHFTYKENINKPFLYDFTCQFVGEPTQTQIIKQGTIEAQQDKNSLKLSLVTSDSGFSLGYGF